MFEFIVASKKSVAIVSRKVTIDQERNPMFAVNPFGELAGFIPPAIMQTYVVVMILLVVGGTIFDVVHKRSAVYFSAMKKNAMAQGERQLGAGEVAGIAVKTAAVDVLTSAEFCNPNRRKAHLLKMYGFVINVVMTIVLVFGYTGGDATAPSLVIALWYIGALMVCAGGIWFWFFIRVDVYSEGATPFQLVRADLFILSLLGSMAFGLIWAVLQTGGGGSLAMVFLALYLIATTVLFAGVPWSKFAHMFFKPAAAFEKRLSKANGFAKNLPTLTRDDPEQQKRHSMNLLQDAPMDMGLGIKRETPNHY